RELAQIVEHDATELPTRVAQSIGHVRDADSERGGHIRVARTSRRFPTQIDALEDVEMNRLAFRRALSTKGFHCARHQRANPLRFEVALRIFCRDRGLLAELRFDA